MRILVLFFVIFSLFQGYVFAETGSGKNINALTTSETIQNSSVKGGLSLLSIQAIKQDRLLLTFNKKVKPTSMRITVENQTTKESIRVVTYSTVGSGPELYLYLESKLNTSTTYKLTINTATAEDGDTIASGVDAIKEFTTPDQFKENSGFINNNISLSNETTTTTVSSGNTEKVEQIMNNSASAPIVDDNTSIASTGQQNEGNQTSFLDQEKTLPATGFEATVFFAIAAILAIFILGIARKKHNT